MKSIVVGTDGSPNAEAAVRRAVEIAKGTGAVVNLVTAFPETHYEGIASSARQDKVDMVGVAESVLARARREPEEQGVKIETYARGGDPARVIVEIAEEVDADVIIVGARGQSAVKRFLLGSVSSKLSHHAPCDLMIVRED